MPRKDGTKSAEERNAEERAMYDAQIIVTRCSIEGCGWKWEGPAGEGRDLFAQHRRLQHKDQIGEPPADPLLDVVRDIIGHGETVEIRLPEMPVKWRADWIRRLGGRIVIDPLAPMPLQLQRDKNEANSDGHVEVEGAEALARMDGGEPQKPKVPAKVIAAPAKPATAKWTRESVIQAVKDWAAEHGRPPSRTDWNGPSTERWPNYQTAARVFGGTSWGDVIVAAGFDRPVRGRTYAQSGAASSTPAPRPLEPDPIPEPEAEPEPIRSDPETPGTTGDDRVEEPAALPAVVEPEPAPLPASVAVRMVGQPDSVDVFELLGHMATDERIAYYERLAEQAQLKAEALRSIKDAVESVRAVEA